MPCMAILQLLQHLGSFDCYVNLAENAFFLLVSTSRLVSLHTLEDLGRPEMPAVRQINLDEVLDKTRLSLGTAQVRRILSTPEQALLCFNEDLVTLNFAVEGGESANPDVAHAGRKSGRLFKVMGATGSTTVICLSWLIVRILFTQVWRRADRRRRTPQSRREKIVLFKTLQGLG